MKRFTKKNIALIITCLLMILNIHSYCFAASSNDYSVGDSIELGSYPQNLVTDETLLNQLNAIQLDWISYEYCSGEGRNGTMSAKDYMKYADVELNEKKYRAVYFTEYRPDNIFYPFYDESQENISCQYSNGYLKNTVYWFEYKPIKWKILDPKTGLMLSDFLLDSQPFCNTIYEKSPEIYNDEECTIFANDYPTSSIRKWLNESFINTAFNSSENKILYASQLTTEDQNDICDKVFLLSVDDVVNKDYGFSSYDSSSITRVTSGTDYAKVQGLFSTGWRLRSPGLSSLDASYITPKGAIDNFTSVGYIFWGIRPAIKIDLNKYNCIHANKITVSKVNATCTEDGFTEGIWCDNCETWLDGHEIIPKTGQHSFTVYISDNNAKCLEDGTKTAKCDNCEETETIRDEGSATGHNYELEDVYKPNCNTDGYGIYICTNCEDSYYDYDNYKATSHKDENGDGICDECTEDVDEESKNEKCSCLCHSSGFMKIIYKIVRFLWSIFKINKVCGCGIAHY